MANLPENAEFTEGIYQLEQLDPVHGGPDGIDNLQAKQLANRTVWLKQEVETLQQDLGNVDAYTQAEVDLLLGGKITQAQGDVRYVQLSSQSDYLDLESNLMIVRETNASTGTFIGSGTTRQYRLNTEVVNNITGASLLSNSSFILPSGRFYIEGFFQCIKGNLFVPRLYNYDLASYITNGLSINGITNSGEALGPISTIRDFFDLSEPTTLQMICHMSHTSNVVSGNDAGHGVDNIYNELRIRKIGD
ncbi:Phage tail fiber protein [gamma proteobacterium IMCC1989]|nr:Phage tail fiber protein [gamma proteobacterium IMCC1989]